MSAAAGAPAHGPAVSVRRLAIALAASLVPAGVLVRWRPADLASIWE